MKLPRKLAAFLVYRLGWALMRAGRLTSDALLAAGLWLIETGQGLVRLSFRLVKPSPESWR